MGMTSEIFVVYSYFILNIAGHRLYANLILLRMSSFDVILGLDWLIKFRATIDCY